MDDDQSLCENQSNQLFHKPNAAPHLERVSDIEDCSLPSGHQLAQAQMYTSRTAQGGNEVDNQTFLMSLRLRMALFVMQQPPASHFKFPIPTYSFNTAEHRKPFRHPVPKTDRSLGFHSVTPQCGPDFESFRSRRADVFQPRIAVMDFHARVNSNILAYPISVYNHPHKLLAGVDHVRISDDQATISTNPANCATRNPGRATRCHFRSWSRATPARVRRTTTRNKWDVDYRDKYNVALAWRPDESVTTVLPRLLNARSWQCSFFRLPYLPRGARALRS
ncbi:hypothetical protein B0J17DRAFT_732648 [Rhizoctonia solani]|nr:hypothetical protein B0J17DRAFT_732648 [Rhizoctonia solani]